jgi:peptidoglycan/xylan/chitin deacetylase (PgdA/CDA1 family)
LNRRAGRALALAIALALPRAAALPPLVLNYHRIEVPARVTYAPTAARLADQVRGLQALGYRFVTASELARALAAGSADGLAALTFDDGDASVVRALPFLADLNVPATVFVIGDRLGAPGALGVDDLRALVVAGWEVGSHGLTHARLTDLTPTRLARELDAAIVAIAAATGAPPATFAYPFGLHDARVRVAVAARHAAAFTTGPGHPAPGDDPRALPRPPTSPLDGFDVAWRADADGNGLTVALAVAATAWVAGPATATSAPRVAGSPTAWRGLGDGGYELDAYDGTLTQAFSVRDGPWALHALQARGSRPASALALARTLPGATVALTWGAIDGWGAGAAVGIGGRGEAWAWWSQGAGWRLGAEAILADGVRALGAWRAGDGALDVELRAALPVGSDEGRPVAVLVGVRGEGAAIAPHLGATVRVGGSEGSARLDARGGLGLALAVRW